LQSEWQFQGSDPVRETRYSLQLPAGWEYKESWLNYPALNPVVAGNRQQWTVSEVQAIRPEPEMPPLEGVAGQMIVSFFPSGGPSIANGFSDWRQMGFWYANLEQGRATASPQIKQQVANLTIGRSTRLEKMQAIAEFVQHDIRYVAVELGIGGWQPHPAADIFFHRYGDCKDKSTLMRSMLHEIGTDSYQVAINTVRGSVTPATPAHQGFDHAIVAIKLPQGFPMLP
jgi:transglutaminase-like putative cysteine protease